MEKKFLARLASKYADKSYTYAKYTGITILLGLFVYRLLLIFSYNGELAGIDNNLVYDVTRGIAGYPIYTDPAAAPYAITLYSPLYFTVCTAIGQLLHINPDDPIQVYQLCRSVSFICDMISIFLLYRLLRRRFRIATEFSWLAASGFACILCVLGYTFSRPDSLLLTFYTATLFVLINPLPQVSFARPLWLAILSAACILSKQNGIIVPILILTWLLLQKERKTAILYAAFFIVLFGSALLIYWNNYPYLFKNAVRSLQNRIDFSWFYTDIFKRMMNSLWMLPLYLAAILSVRLWIKPVSGTDRALTAIFIIQTLFSLGTSFKWGSTAGYFNESFFLSIIIIVRSVTRTKAEPQPYLLKNATAVFLPLFFLFFIHTVAEGYLFFLQNKANKKLLYGQQKQIRDDLQTRFIGNVLNLANPNSDFFKTLFYREIVVPNMDMVDCCTLPDKTFDYSALRQDIADGKIMYIIAADNEEIISLWGISLERFSLYGKLNGYAIYRFVP